MSLPPDPWEPWYSDFQQAYAANDVARLQRALARVPIDFHGQRNLRHERWEELFLTLLRLLESEHSLIRRGAYGRVMTVALTEYGPPYEPHTHADWQRNLTARIDTLLPALSSLVQRDPALLRLCTQDLVSAETQAGLAWQTNVAHWLSSLELPEPPKLAARIAYVDALAPWDSVRSFLFATLDHDDVLVRAATARTIGERYRDGVLSDMTPPFKEVVELITEKEILRPGLAAPLFKGWHQWTDRSFEVCAEVKLEEWIYRILEHRKGLEPILWPWSDGIEVFAREIFATHPDYVRKLLDLGQEALALEAATGAHERIDGMEPLLLELGARSDAELCRRASSHLAYHYHRLHPDGAKRGFVRQVSLASIDLFLIPSDDGNPASLPYSITLYPRDRASFDGAEALRYVDAALPSSIRGALAACRGFVGSPVGAYLDRKTARCRYSAGANVSFYLHGEAAPIAGCDWNGGVVDPSALAERRWEHITILWPGRHEVWNPELLLQGE